MSADGKGAGWKIVRSEILIDSPHLRLRSDDIELPDGSLVKDYYVRESRGFAVVFAIAEDERVVLVRQYKHGAGGRLLELPAGGIDAGETALDCAARELTEETAYVAGGRGLESIGRFVVDASNSTARFELFLARDARRTGKQELERTEDIEVEFATFKELRRFVSDGTIESAPQVAAIYYALDYLGKI
ncbi:MAG: NUDIX hydrolase [Candidatus Eremiobacteraeota bacterium]|nr:NUDIX hydrolase [Candidatus Eremiobacteraeota bacterium]